MAMVKIRQGNGYGENKRTMAMVKIRQGYGYGENKIESWLW